jgi:hypothetical protein
VHEDAGQVELHLEADVDVGAVYGGRPPEGEAAVGDLVEARALGVGELFEFHGLLETGGFLPEEALPCGEVGAFEQGVLQDAFDPSQRLYHIRPVIIQIPQFSIMLLMRPPKGILLQQLILLKILPNPPPLIIRQRQPILLKQRINPRYPMIPTLFQIIQRQPPILTLRLLALHSILRPHPLTINKLRLPGLDVAVEVGDELVLLVRHAGAEVRDALLGLLGEA